jgi:Protein of unknown function (DUF1592)/Protein of unknown function (DUF1588)/Protein of unknown function (DUF1585)/Protein of unknown function (DUF1587)/Protein of unknown function (DUF1595)
VRDGDAARQDPPHAAGALIAPGTDARLDPVTVTNSRRASLVAFVRLAFVLVAFGLVAFGGLLTACTGIISPSPGAAPGSSPGGAAAGTGGPGVTSSGTGGAGGTLPIGTGGASAAACVTPAAAPDFHRLNAKQYEETVNQLLGLALPLRQDLPADSTLYGFDNGADTTITAALTQRYLDAAKKAVTTALATPAARAGLVTCDLTKNAATGAACVRTILTTWLPRAFRRPVLASELDAYVAYTKTCPSSAEAGLSCALQAALLSPKFLFRGEVLPDPVAAVCTESAPLTSTPAGILSQYALASRLSYFLWNAPPDDALTAAAAAGTLNDPAALAAQVDRMLAAPMLATHTVSFAQDFPQQWLPLDALATAQPSPTLFPLFDAPLRQAMHDESQLFFQDVLLNNGSALDLLRADFTYVNARLAQHYGIAGVTGTQMRRVATTGTTRGGIPTQGSFLTATSSTENTSLVLRAKWVLTNLLCVDLPPPPPKALIDSVPVPDPGLGLTNRESLEIRTAGEPCHSCHVNINPIGFGLESFDAVGATRTTDHGKAIDSSGVMPGGATFANTGEMLDLLRADDRFAGCVTKKMLTYALGRGLVQSCDAQAIDGLAAALKADGYKLRNHLVRIVQSDLFRSPRAREVTP